MTAVDPVRPMEIGTARVRIIVNRNAAGPVCLQSQFTQTISEYLPVPSPIGTRLQIRNDDQVPYFFSDFCNYIN